MTAAEVAADVQSHRHPLLIADLGLTEGMPLSGRGFVVPQGWQEQAP
jgi:hypothetical protein